MVEKKNVGERERKEEKKKWEKVRGEEWAREFWWEGRKIKR